MINPNEAERTPGACLQLWINAAAGGVQHLIEARKEALQEAVCKELLCHWQTQRAWLSSVRAPEPYPGTAD